MKPLRQHLKETPYALPYWERLGIAADRYNADTKNWIEKNVKRKTELELATT